MMILHVHLLALSFVSEREITSTSDETNLRRNPNKIAAMKPFRSSRTRNVSHTHTHTKARPERGREGKYVTVWVFHTESSAQNRISDGQKRFII